MTNPGFGQFHVYYHADDGTEYRKAYRTFDEADKARDFLEALGVDTVGIEMNTKSREWKPDQ